MAGKVVATIQDDGMERRQTVFIYQDGKGILMVHIYDDNRIMVELAR